MPDDLVDYLRGQRDAYTRAALTQRAIDAGYSPWHVEAAWDRLEAEDERSGRPLRRGPAMRIAAIVLIAIVVLAYGLLTVAAAGYMTSTQGSFFSATSGDRVVLSIYVIAMIIVGAVSVVRLWRAPNRARGVSALASAIAISAVSLFGLSGLCIVGLGVVP